MTIRFMHSVVLCLLFVVTPVFAETLTVQLSSEPTQYDPLFLEDAIALRIASNVIATPYEYDGRGKKRKNLVSDLSISKDKKKYTIRFKKNLKWSDGVSFHASQFVAAIHRIVKEPVKAALSSLYPEFDLSLTKVVDSHTVEVALKNPDAQFTEWLCLPPFSPIRDDLLENFSKRNPVVPTLAAYQVIEYKREDYLLLKKNPEFEQKDSVLIDQVKIRFIKDEASSLALLKSGEVDILTRVPALQLDQIRKMAEVVDVPVEGVIYLGLNTKKPPFNEVQNRRALMDALFLKRSALTNILKTGEVGANTFLPDILMPQQVKAKIKYQKPNEKPELKLEFQAQSDGGSRNQTMLEYVQSILKSEYGWKMKINLMDWKAHYSKIKSDADSVIRFGWQNPVSDPYVVYQVLESNSTNNYTGWSNVEYDQLVKKLKFETNSARKAELIGKIEELLLKEVPVVPVLSYVVRFANSKRVLGFRANPFGVILFRELRLGKD